MVAVLGAGDVEDDVFAAADVDGLVMVEDGVPGAVGGLVLGGAGGAAGVFDVDVLDVGAEVGEAPGDVVVVADDDEGSAGERDSGDVEGAPVGVGASRSASYQMPGTLWVRCMSFERSGLPEAVWAPETTQLLEPARQASQTGLRVCWRARSAWRLAGWWLLVVGWVGEFGLGFVEGDVGDVLLGGGEVDEGLGGWVVAPGADGVEVGDEVRAGGGR